jgi:hypothetical protein
MDVSKDLWGPALWRFYQITAAVQTDRQAFNDSLRLMCRLLPCPECRLHLKEYLEQNPPEEIIFDTEDASAYVLSLHNSVNERTRKPVFAVPEYEALYGPVNRRIVPARFSGNNAHAPPLLGLGATSQGAIQAGDVRSLLMGAMGRAKAWPRGGSSLSSRVPAGGGSRPIAQRGRSQLAAVLDDPVGRVSVAEQGEDQPTKPDSRVGSPRLRQAAHVVGNRSGSQLVRRTPEDRRRKKALGATSRAGNADPSGLFPPPMPAPLERVGTRGAAWVPYQKRHAAKGQLTW